MQNIIEEIGNLDAWGIFYYCFVFTSMLVVAFIAMLSDGIFEKKEKQTTKDKDESLKNLDKVIKDETSQNDKNKDLNTKISNKFQRKKL